MKMHDFFHIDRMIIPSQNEDRNLPLKELFNNINMLRTALLNGIIFADLKLN